MWKNSSLIALLAVGLLLTSCQSTYDKLLTSANNELKLEKAYEYYQAEDFYKAQMLFEQVMPFYRGTPQIDTVYYHYAYSHYYQENFILAAYYFKTFTQTFSTSPFIEEAYYMSAYANYEMSPNPKLDQTYTLKAIEGFQLFANRFPTSTKVQVCNALIDEMRKKLEEKAIAGAELYYKLDNFQSADNAYRNILIDYPDSKDAEKIRYRIVQASFKLAENTIETKQSERYEKVIQNCQDFKKRHPQSTYLNSVEAYLKTSKNQLKRLASANS